MTADANALSITLLQFASIILDSIEYMTTEFKVSFTVNPKKGYLFAL